MDTAKTSATQFAYETIKEWILAGILPPGEKIDQDDAAQKLGLSRMPVRSALEKLAADGLTIVTPHRGAKVSPLSDVVLNNLFDTRAQIESMSIMLTTAHASNSDIDKLYNMLQYQYDLGDNSIKSILEQNRNFHRYITYLSGNEVLLRVFDNLWEQCERYRRIYFRVPRSNDRVAAEHRKIVDLIAGRTPQAAADFMIEHTRTSQRALLEAMGKHILPLRFKMIYLQPNGD